MPSDFDFASRKYDEEFTFSKIGRAQRNRVHYYMNSILPAKKKWTILELNCGTGEDALYFLNHGHHVLATDISKEMIQVARSKLAKSNAVFKVQDINALSNTFFEQKFDLIFSNFGGLNCLTQHQLQSFFEAALNLLSPKGKLVVVMMSKSCLWEKVYYSLKGNFKKASRRSRNTKLLVNVNGTKVSTWYFTPKEIISFTQKNYVTNRIKPIGISIPPSYLEKSFLTHTYLLPFLNTVEKFLGFSFLAQYADHFLIEITKK